MLHAHCQTTRFQELGTVGGHASGSKQPRVGGFHRLLERQGDFEGRAALTVALDPNSASVRGSDFAANGKPKPRSGNLFAMQSFESTKDEIVVGGSDARSIVAKRDKVTVVRFLTRDLYMRPPVAAVLDGIVD